MPYISTCCFVESVLTYIYNNFSKEQEIKFLSKQLDANYIALDSKRFTLYWTCTHEMFANPHIFRIPLRISNSSLRIYRYILRPSYYIFHTYSTCLKRKHKIMWKLICSRTFSNSQFKFRFCGIAFLKIEIIWGSVAINIKSQ